MPYPQRDPGLLERALFVWDDTAGKFVALETLAGGLAIMDRPYDASGMVEGTKTVAVTNTAVRLVAASTPCLGVHITALANSGIIYYGFNSGLTTSNGKPVTPYKTIWLPINDAHDLWINGTAGDGFAFDIYAT